jgi:hypothetical protein
MKPGECCPVLRDRFHPVLSPVTDFLLRLHAQRRGGIISCYGGEGLAYRTHRDAASPCATSSSPTAALSPGPSSDATGYWRLPWRGKAFNELDGEVRDVQTRR